jgi:hypothetical protein
MTAPADLTGDAIILPAGYLPHFRGLAGKHSYKNKPLLLKKAACLPPKRLSRAMADRHFPAVKEAFGINPICPIA